MFKSYHVENETIRMLLKHLEAMAWPRGTGLATFNSLRDDEAEATQTEIWDEIQEADGTMLPLYCDAYE